MVYDFDQVVEVEEKPLQEKPSSDTIDWPVVSSKATRKNVSSIEFRLPEDDDRCEPTSSELSELEGFHSDVEDHDHNF